MGERIVDIILQLPWSLEALEIAVDSTRWRETPEINTRVLLRHIPGKP